MDTIKDMMALCTQHYPVTPIALVFATDIRPLISFTVCSPTVFTFIWLVPISFYPIMDSKITRRIALPLGVVFVGNISYPKCARICFHHALCSLIPRSAALLNPTFIHTTFWYSSRHLYPRTILPPYGGWGLVQSPRWS